jgi:hypothetical protein
VEWEWGSGRSGRRGMERRGMRVIGAMCMVMRASCVGCLEFVLSTIHKEFIPTLTPKAPEKPIRKGEMMYFLSAKKN